MRKAGLDTETQKPITVYCEGEVVGEFVAEGKPVGLILNFGERKVEIKRKVKDLN